MRILLIGEYSNVHWTLSEGLRKLRHEVCVVSDGDSWKNYCRDIDLSRKSLGKFDTFRYLLKVKKIFKNLKDYDVVQLINPIFLDLRAKRIRPFYDMLRKNNRKLFIGAFGMDHYWVKTCLDCKTFKYSDFNIGERSRKDEPLNKIYIKDWLYGEKSGLNIDMAKDCDGVIAGLYEYYKCYYPEYPAKTAFIPFPINTADIKEKTFGDKLLPVKFFIGIQKNRSVYKGTDIMLKALERLQKDYPERCEIKKAESVPYDEYQKMINDSDCLLDQLYSYTPAMNGLLAMSKGLVLVGGGEEEQYEIIHENKLRPIINVLPSEDDVYNQLKTLIFHPERIKTLSKESTEYILKHHDYVKVAQQYVDFWDSHGQT